MNYCPECGHDLKQYTGKDPSYPPKRYSLTLSMMKLRLFDLAREGDILTIKQPVIDEGGGYAGLRKISEPGRYRLISVDRPVPGMVNTALFILEKV